MPFCPNCGAQVPDSVNFCQKCGNPIGGPVQRPSSESTVPREMEYYRGEGNMIVKTIRQQGTVVKVGVFLVTGPVGHLIWGRDKKKKVTGTGSLMVTNKAIYFAGRVTPSRELEA